MYDFQMILFALAVLACSTLKVGVAQECEAQVVLTTQEDLKKQISSEIRKSLNGFSCNTTPIEPSTESPTLSRLEAQLNKIEAKIDKLQRDVNRFHEDGTTPCHAASSCADILADRPNAPSGYYWVKNATGHPHSVFCDMTRSCDGTTRGWMRVAHLDMTNRSNLCPRGLKQRTDSHVRTCAPQSDSATCSSVVHPSSGIPYSKVCGKINAYHVDSMDGFYRIDASATTIDSNYVDGVSLTHGRAHREHIWTFASRHGCPCGTPPAFVNNDYFCDGARLFAGIDLHNLLWDGEDCGIYTCCTLNNPPWFHKQLPRPTTDDIEMRVCRDSDRGDEDLAIEVIEIYVQ